MPKRLRDTCHIVLTDVVKLNSHNDFGVETILPVRLAQGIFGALGASAVFYAAMSLIGIWVYTQQATAFGAMVSGSSLGDGR